jgi:dihydrofolate reductase
MTIRMIAAVSLNGVIGYKNTLPWGNDYPEDLNFFKEQTINSTIIMGRNTFKSIGKALPKRRNIVLSSKVVPRLCEDGIETFLSLEKALSECTGDVWLIGGSSVYQEGLRLAEEIYITTIPKFIKGDNLIYFPYVNPDLFVISRRIELSESKNLYCNIYEQINKITSKIKPLNIDTEPAFTPFGPDRDL